MSSNPRSLNTNATRALVLALVATAWGALITRVSGHAIAPFATNLAAALIAFALVSALRRQSLSSASLSLATLALVALTLVCPGISGVHRWLSAGPVHLHASAALLPIAILAMHALAPRHAIALVLALQAVHFAQPDAAQSTALGAASIVWALSLPQRSPRARGALAVLFTALALAPWLRADPLAPVVTTERIFVLAASHGAAVLAVTLGVTLALCVPLLTSTHRAAPALAVYWMFVVWAPLAGNFPVPLLGAGAGHVLGYIALLAGIDRCVTHPAPARAER